MTPRAPHPLEARCCDFVVPGVVPERPRFAREAFSGPLLGGGLAHHGWLLVEGLLDTDATRELVETVDRAGVSAAIDTCLGEPGFLSVGKTTLRRIAPTALPNGWHQDGAFLGEAIRTMTCWIALTDCGVDSPGLDIVPIRPPGLFERGTRGTFFPWVGSGHRCRRRRVQGVRGQRREPRLPRGRRRLLRPTPPALHRSVYGPA